MARVMSAPAGVTSRLNCKIPSLKKWIPVFSAPKVNQSDCFLFFELIPSQQSVPEGKGAHIEMDGLKPSPFDDGKGSVDEVIRASHNDHIQFLHTIFDKLIKNVKSVWAVSTGKGRCPFISQRTASFNSAFGMEGTVIRLMLTPEPETVTFTFFVLRPTSLRRALRVSEIVFTSSLSFREGFPSSPSG